MEVLGYSLNKGMNENLCWWETLGRVLPLVGMWHEQKKKHTYNIQEEAGEGGLAGEQGLGSTEK